MTVGAGDNDLGDHGGGHFQIIQKLIATRDVIEIYQRIIAEENLLHVGEIGELDDALFHALKLSVQLGFNAFGKSLKGAFKLILGKGVNEQIVQQGNDKQKKQHNSKADLQQTFDGKGTFNVHGQSPLHGWEECL